MKITIRPAIKEDIHAIASHIRPADADELWSAAYATPTEAMTSGLRDSEESYTGLIDDVPVCMWGVSLESLIGNVGMPWMVATTMADEHAMTFLRQCRKDVTGVLSKYKKLFNHVDARNTKAIAWLKWLGFAVEEPAPYGMMSMPFHRFTMERKPIKEGLDIRPCTMAELKSNRNFERLRKEYSDECAIMGLPSPDEKMAVYPILEKSGFMYPYGAFLGRKLVGFMAVMIPIIPHLGVCVAVTESIFVGKNFRSTGAGHRLIAAAKAHAKSVKSPGLLISTPFGGQLEQVLTASKEWRQTNSVFFTEFYYAG